MAVAGIGGLVLLAWLAYAVGLLLFGIAGESCVEADRSTCTAAAPLAYGVGQLLLALAGSALGARALASLSRGLWRGEAPLRARAGRAALVAAVAWAVLVGIRWATASVPF